LRERTRLAALDRENGGFLCQAIEGIGRRVEASRDEKRREHRVDETRAVLGPDSRKVAPNLAPARRAGAILDFHQQHGPVVHHAERGRDGLLQRAAIDAGLDATDGEGLAHGLRSMSR
jgi:hypothetical protein